MTTVIPSTMKGVTLIGHGGTEMLEFRDDIPVPKLCDDEVLIQVEAAGVNNTDLNTRLAWYSKQDHHSQDASWSGTPIQFPLIQGADVCGTIVAVGKEVNIARIGERVLIEPCLTRAEGKPLDSPWYFGSECHGGFAQYTKVAQQHAYGIKSKLSSIELASFPCSYSTAENMLTRAKVSYHDTVLVSGASGGVGSAAIQLAKARGAKVIAISSPSKFEQLTALGADITVSRHEDLLSNLDENSIDVVIDLVAGEKWSELLTLLKPKGRYAVSGAIGGALVELDIRTLYLKDLSFFGCTLLEPNVFKRLIDYIENEQIVPLVAKSFELSEIAKAQADFLDKKHVGKIVLSIPKD